MENRISMSQRERDALKVMSAVVRISETPGTYLKNSQNEPRTKPVDHPSHELRVFNFCAYQRD
jgi:hypothetical protein